MIHPNEVKRNVGKFKIPSEMLIDPILPDVLATMRFVPIHVDSSFWDFTHEFMGYSPLFHDTLPGERPPEYMLQVTGIPETEEVAVVAVLSDEVTKHLAQEDPDDE